MEHTFKALKLQPHEFIWLEEVHKYGVLDVKSTKVKLLDKLPTDFDHKSISLSLYRRNHLTLLGMWHIDKDNQYFDLVDKTIRLIQSLIKQNPKIETVYAADVAERLQISEETAQTSLYLMSELGHFYSSACGFPDRPGHSQISFSKDSDSAFDEYLYYTCLDDQIEKFYLNFIQSSKHRAPFQPLPIPALSFSDRQQSDVTPDFDALKLPGKFSDHLAYRWNEARKCYEANAWLASTILYGSILETILIAALSQDEETALSSPKAPKRSGSACEIRDWKLEAMLNVAADIQMIGDNLAKHGHALRDSRNLIHPLKQVEERTEADKELADIARLVTLKVMKSLCLRSRSQAQDDAN